MNFQKLHWVVFALFLLIFSGCASKEARSLSDEELYTKALEALEEKQLFTASQFLNKIERDFPYSRFSSNALLLNAYISYLRQDYEISILKLDLYNTLYPASDALPYAFYIRALSFFERMEDPNRDQNFTLEAKGEFEKLIRRFPDSVYAKDSRLRYDGVLENLAAHELYVGKFYQNQEFYIAAITRFETIINYYDTSSILPEAMYRLIESYISLGINDEAIITSRVLSYNFPDSSWTKKSKKLLAQRNIVKESVIKS